MIIDIIYSRVSKENETLQDLYVQEQKLIEKFNLKNPTIFRERGSAYKIENFKKREEFIKILNLAFDIEHTTLKDIFLQNFKKKQINIYVWDSHRIMRNIEFSLFFQLLSDLYGIEIYTYKDGKLKDNEDETPSKKLLRYMVMAIHAYSGEEYSYTTSENIKKSFVKKGNKSYSKYGLKIGRKFRKIDGTKINLPYEKLEELNKKIIKLHKKFQSQGYSIYYNHIIQKIKQQEGLIISKSYISRLK